MTDNEPESAVGSDSKSKANIPPAVITVDTTGKEASETSTQNDGKSTPEEKSIGQARTPKHANKGRDEDAKGSAKSQITPERQQAVKSIDQCSRQAAAISSYGSFSPSRPYEGRSLGGGGAFQPHESRQQPLSSDPPAFYTGPGGRPPMHVSPPHGHAEYRPGYYGGPPPGPPPPGVYPSAFDQRYAPEGPYGGPPPGQYRGPPYPPSYRVYDQGTSWGGPPYQRPPPPPYPGMPPEAYQHRPPGNIHQDALLVEQRQAAHGNTFSRAVSSSFGSNADKPAAHPKMDPSMPFHAPNPSMQGPPDDHSDGASWGQLNQVASVDEAVMRERMEKREADSHHKGDQPASNSSSLTNSPTDQHEAAGAAKRASIPTPSKLASLDSLSSVASAQEPLTTGKEKFHHGNSSVGHLSPGSSASLDLLKCSSGSSGLLHLASTQVTFPPCLETRRARDDEERDATNDKYGENSARRAPSDPDGKVVGNDHRPTKKSRRDDDAKIKQSPLSITCSPGADKAKDGGACRRASQENASSKQDPRFSQSPGTVEGTYLDKASSYTYSMDSAPPLPKDNIRQAGYPPLPHRPGSSSSSTITPMQVEGHDGHTHPGIGNSLPSWEIQQQDSFSGGSAGGGAPLMSSFSFTQDYPMLSSSGSNLGLSSGEGGIPQQPPGHAPYASHPTAHQQTIESRNQSFEGGHYHGSFSRTESMDMSYGGRPNGPYDRQHPGYIHHAPSWGSHGPPPGYGHYNPRLAQSGSFSHGPGPMMRNYSGDERISPPPGPPGMRLGPGGIQRTGFQPPPEFMAPANPHLNRRPQQAVYLMSSPPGGHQQPKNSANGSFSWSKDDDIRLSEVMKKYKNPRDWEPIAKEHGRGKRYSP